MGGQAGNTSAMRGGGAGNPAAPYAGLPQAGMAANRASMDRRFGNAMRPPGSGLQSPPSMGVQPVGGMGTQGAGDGGADMMSAGARGGSTMPLPPPGGVAMGPPGGMGNPGPQAPMPGMGNAQIYRPGMVQQQEPDFAPLIQAMGQPKPQMQGGTGAIPMPGGLQSQPAPNQWNTTGRDQAMRLLGSSTGRSPYRP